MSTRELGELLGSYMPYRVPTMETSFATRIPLTMKTGVLRHSSEADFRARILRPLHRRQGLTEMNSR